jgi:hypothetical protein
MKATEYRRLELFSIVANSIGLLEESYSEKSPLARRSFQKIKSSISDLFSEIESLPTRHEINLDGPAWVEALLNFIETFDDECQAIKYKPYKLAKQLGFSRAHSACYGFEGDMFVDSNGRCFVIDAVCDYDPNDDYPQWLGYDEPEYVLRAGKDYSSVARGMYGTELYMRRSDPKAFHYCKWDKESLLKYKTDKNKKTGTEPYRGMYFILSAAAAQISEAIEEQKQNEKHNNKKQNRPVH